MRKQYELLKFQLATPSMLYMDKIKNIVFAFFIMAVWVFSITSFLSALNIPLPASTSKGLFFTCIWAPVWEEIAFRWAPISVAKRVAPHAIWPVIIIASAIFGWGHGLGPISLLIQGMMGIVLSLLYIKNNYSLWSSMVLHSMWNSSIFFFLM